MKAAPVPKIPFLNVTHEGVPSVPPFVWWAFLAEPVSKHDAAIMYVNLNH